MTESKTAVHTAENWCEVASEAIKLVPGYTEENIPKELLTTYEVLMNACRDSQLIGERSGDFWLARHKELAAEFVHLAGLPEGSGTVAARAAFESKKRSHDALVAALRTCIDNSEEWANGVVVKLSHEQFAAAEAALKLAEEGL